LQQGIDTELRSSALRALFDLQHVQGVDKAIASHLDRYIAEGGAIPKEITVKAPRLEHPDTGMTVYIAEEIKKTRHDLLLVIGSGAADMARTRQADLRDMLEGHEIFFLTPELAPEEQMDALEEARDRAAANPEHTVFAIGVVPAPSDSPPLRHFLTTGAGTFTAQVLVVDPHEVSLLMDWWHYVDDRAEVETEFWVVLSASTPERSAISEEEHLIYQLTPDERKPDFIRALLAHL
jgi:hypothetical protein